MTSCLGADLDFLELAQGAQSHIENRFGLIVAELEALHENGLRLVLAADDADHLIDIEIGNEIAVKYLEAPGDLAQAGSG